MRRAAYRRNSTSVLPSPRARSGTMRSGPRRISSVPHLRKEHLSLAADPGPPYRRLVRGPAVYIVVVMLGLLVFLSFFNRQGAGETMTVPQYEDALSHGTVDTAKFLELDHKVVGALKDGTGYEVTYPEAYAETLINEVKDADVQFESDPQNGS